MTVMRWWLALFAWLLLIPPVAQARPLGDAVVSGRLTADGLHVTVSLGRPVTRFVFAEASVTREGDIELLTPGLTLEGDVVTAPASFSRFEYRVRPMTQERDAKYPAFHRVGDGGVLYAPALKADPATWRTRLSFALDQGQVQAPSTGDVSDGFIYVGPAALHSEGDRIAVIADPAVPSWLVERSRTALAAAVDRFTSTFGIALPRKPLLIVKHEESDRNFNVGDVTPGAVTSLRFHGEAWKHPDEAAGRAIQTFLLHEAFHFWNGGIASHSEHAPAWLHEGGAEYAALLAGQEMGVLGDEDVRQRLSEALQRCRFALQEEGDKGLSEIAVLTNQIRYPCGMVLQWAADLSIRTASGGSRTVLDAWANMIRTARDRTPATYGLADFYTTAGLSDGSRFLPARLLVDENGPQRWAALADALNALGAEVVQRPTPQGRRATLLFHLLRQNCRDLPPGTGVGFQAEGATIKLDSPAGCGVLAGSPLIESVEGGDPFAMTAETYAAVQRKCAMREPVVLTIAGGDTLSAACAAPLSPAPEDYVVNSWRTPTRLQ